MTQLREHVFVTGATGYIGSRLVPRLLDKGYSVTCFVRDPEKLAMRPWSEHTDVRIEKGDIEDTASTARAMQGAKTAYYLVHSMLSAGSSYAEHDRKLARAFATAAAQAGIEQIVYLGGLGETGKGLSEHLSSRREVEVVLGETGIDVTVLRAAMIIGSGSASFEILRYLVERLPVMVTPKWVQTRVQPIGVRNVLDYLVACLETPAVRGRVFDIGGRDVLTYAELMQVMARARGLRARIVLPVPLLTPRLSSLWIHLVTPIDRRMARPLAEGLRNEVVCRNDEAERAMPCERLLDAREAIELAIANLEADRVESSWSAAGPMPGDPDWSGGSAFVDRWRVEIEAPQSVVYRSVCRVGGGHGYYAGDALWRLRGIMDRLVGGPGLRRGRRASESVSYGEALDFWRVTRADEPERLELHAEMKLPGIARLGFEVERLGEARSRLVMNARFLPRGLFGLAYWYAVLPFHGYVFRGMLHGIRRDAQRAQGTTRRAPIERIQAPREPAELR
ncbi:MAG: SDR family oxidoreductase [Planctomycetes bacterium]|nr:SDR family oxidoreductase [Planctomycetota bacterium]